MNKFEINLYMILNDISNYNRNRYDILKCSINDRLNNSLISYYKDIYLSYNYLKYKNQLKVLKGINKHVTNR